MPISREVRQLGGRWLLLVERVSHFARTMPVKGLTLAAFERSMLLDVDPHVTSAVVEALHSRGVIWRRRNRGAVRIFAARPAKISGLLRTAAPAEPLLASSVAYAYRATLALRRREQAKRVNDRALAHEARADLAAALTRMVDLVRSYVERGTALTAIREAMWSIYPGDVMDALATFEQGMARDAVQGALSSVEASPHRIAAGLSPREKTAALIAKANATGMTKTMIYQAIRPKVAAYDLAMILGELEAEGRVEARQVQLRGSGRLATRYFSKAWEAACDRRPRVGATPSPDGSLWRGLGGG